MDRHTLPLKLKHTYNSLDSLVMVQRLQGCLVDNILQYTHESHALLVELLNDLCIGNIDLLPEWADVLIQVRVGVGNPVASQRRITLLPREETTVAAAGLTESRTQWDISSPGTSTVGPSTDLLQVNIWSIRTTRLPRDMEEDLTMEISQLHNQGLSWRPGEHQHVLGA